MGVHSCEICTLKYVCLLEICKMKLYHPNIYPFQNFVSLQEICIPPGNLYPFYSKICTPPGNLYPSRKFVPLQEICTTNMYPSWKFFHQNEISHVVRILLNFDTAGNLYPKICTPPGKFVHQNEISQVVRILLNFDTNIALVLNY